MRFLTREEQRRSEQAVRRPGPLSKDEWATIAAYLETAPATSEEEAWALLEREQKREAAAKKWRLDTINELAQFGMLTRELADELRKQED